MGAQALSDIKASDGRLTGRWHGLAGVVLGAIGTLGGGSSAYRRVQ